MTEGGLSTTGAVLILVAIPLAFAVIWLGITSLLGLISGWLGLSARFPDREDPALARFAGQSGMMGGVSLRNVLTLSPCRGGLRVGMMRLLGPFSRPFYVPWSEIEIEARQRFFGNRAVLNFGRPRAGSLEIADDLAQRIKAAAGR